MAELIHDDETDTSEATVRSLLAAQCPDWAEAPMSYLHTSGTSNAMWRIHIADGDVVVRLPRMHSAAASLHKETGLLGPLAETSLTNLVQVPTMRHSGTPADHFPHPWAVLDWIVGDDAWTARHDLESDSGELAIDLATVVHALRALDDLPAPKRRPGQRGGPLVSLLARLNRWLDDPAWSAAELLDVPAVRRVAAQAAEVAQEPVQECFVHGDLIPGNLLVRHQRLVAVIDWGGAGYADPAQDLGAAWSVFDGDARRAFQEQMDADDAMWLRARTIELEHAVGGVLYYAPRRHPLGDVMARTLARILAD